MRFIVLAAVLAATATSSLAWAQTAPGAGSGNTNGSGANSTSMPFNPPDKSDTSDMGKQTIPGADKNRGNSMGAMGKDSTGPDTDANSKADHSQSMSPPQNGPNQPQTQ